MKFEKLQRQGELYLKSHEYAFHVAGRSIKGLFMLTDNHVNTFVLPDLGKSIIDTHFERDSDDAGNLEMYVYGSAIFNFDGFRNHPGATIIVPSKCSLALTSDYFRHVNLKLFIPKDMEAYTITQKWRELSKEKVQKWTLIADKKLKEHDVFSLKNSTFVVKPYQNGQVDDENLTFEHFEQED